MQPTRTSSGKHTYMTFLFGLASGGVYHAAFVTKDAVRSYRTLSLLLLKGRHARKREDANDFSNLILKRNLLSVALSVGSHHPDVIRHRVFMKPGLSSRHYRAIIQPSGMAFIPTNIRKNQEIESKAAALSVVSSVISPICPC